MSRKSKGQKQKQVPDTPKRDVDVYFETFDKQYQHPVNRIIQYFALPIFWFAFLGLVWMIPFPEIDFLKQWGYDTFLNWGSFFIAGIIYYYLRLSPTLSYAMLLTVGVFSFFIVRLEYMEQAGGPAVWLVCGSLLLISFLALYLGSRLERKPVSFPDFCRLLVLGPVWLWHFAFKKWNIPY